MRIPWQKIKKPVLFSILIVGSATSGFLVRPLLTQSQQNTEKRVWDLHEGNGTQRFQFINPLLACGDFDNVSNRQIENMRQEVQTLIEREKAEGAIAFMSVYFRELNNGPWFGINEQEKFTPGSLLKVPFLVAILKKGDSDPGFLEKKIQYDGGKDSTPVFFPPEKQLQIGAVYSINNLVEAMITYSDNNAALLLAQLIDRKKIEETYDDFGIDPPHDATYVMTVRTYASFFRVLFNATYLTKELSEKALALLAHTSFLGGVHAGVPPSIAVAHKFGERDLGQGQKQLHDCGIVYYPRYPYLLCVMSRGNAYPAMNQAIEHISRTVYTAVQNNMR